MESGHGMLDHPGSSLSFPMKEPMLVPVLPPYLIEPIFEQFSALIPERQTTHPLGCHRPRIPDRVIFEKLVQVLVFGCAYERIADESCSATTLRDRRDEWIELGVMDALRDLALEAYDRFVGLELPDVAVDCCITKAPCGGEKAGRSPVDRGKQGTKRSTAVDANGIPIGAVTAPANRHDSLLLTETLDAVPGRRRHRGAGRAARASEGASGPWLRLEGHPRAARSAHTTRRDLREGQATAPLAATKRWVIERTKRGRILGTMPTKAGVVYGA